MVHGRMIRPAVAGSVPVKVDDSSIKDIPGAQVVWDKGFLGVVADNEWDAIKAAQKLKVEWSKVEPPFPDQAALYDHIRKAPVRKRQVDKENGNVDDAFKTAARVIEAEYEWPFQSHAAMGPACALVEIKDGNVTCWTGTQKSHFVQNGLAGNLGIPRDKIRVIWQTGPGSYGRNDADDCAMDCGVLAKAVGKPVRLQYTREQGTGWDPKGPASIHRARAAIDASGKIIAYEFLSKGFSRVDVNTYGSNPVDTLAGQTRGIDAEIGRRLRRAGGILRVRQQADGVGNDPAAARPRLAAALVASARSGRAADPLRQRVVHGRSGGGAAGRSDRVPPASRQGSARRRGDQGGGARSPAGTRGRRRARPRPATRSRGRGIAYAQRNGTRVAVIAEVDIDRSTGRSSRKGSRAAHDCGQIINPDGLEKCIEGNIVQGISRTLWEEVKFDGKTVTSVDWMTYPILDITETPETIDFVLIDHPETRRRPAPASPRSGRWRRRSPTRSSTPPACASAACRSRRTASRQALS